MNNLRTLIRVDIQIDQQWAIGAAPDLMFRPDPTSASDKERTTRLPVQKDPKGAVLLPATSLVGSLKRHLGENGPTWLGESVGDKTTPSELRALAAIVHGKDALAEFTTTRIDPKRRAADAGSLRREELAPPGLVSWWLEWDHHNASLTLGDLVEDLQTWHPVVGRRRSANRGRAHVASVTYRTFDLNTEADLTWWLAERAVFDWKSTKQLQGWTSKTGGATDLGEVVIGPVSFTVVDGLHIGGLPLDGNCTPTRDTLPSTSWRGVFRHRVAHIVRVSTEGTKDQVEQIVEETCARLFGSARAKGSSDDAGRRGQLRFADSPVSGGKVIRDHVAIDRISGGSAGQTTENILEGKDAGLLYQVECHQPGARLDLTIYNDSGQPVSESDQKLLQQVIRDINDGIVGVGGLTGRGYGTLKLTSKGARS